MKKLILTFTLLGLTACGGLGDPMSSQLEDDIAAGSKTGAVPVGNGVYECEVKYEEYEIDANVIGYTLKDKYEGNLGFDIGGIIKSLYAGMKIEKSQMDMTMSLNEVLYDREYALKIDGQGNGKKNDFKGGIDLGFISIDAGYFTQTPLYTVVKRTVTDALGNMEDEFDKQAPLWKTRVVGVVGEPGDENEVIYLPVGTAALVAPGDRFYIYNVSHNWVGEPCNSKYLGPLPDSQEYVAEVEVLASGLTHNVAPARVRYRNTQEVIKLSAVVYQGKTKNKVLRRPVRVQNVTSNHNLPLGEYGDLDLKPFVKEAIEVELMNYGFQVRRSEIPNGIE